MRKYITILKNEITGEEMSFGCVKKAVDWITDNYPELKVKCFDVWNTKLAEGNVFNIGDFSLRKIINISN